MEAPSSFYFLLFCHDCHDCLSSREGTYSLPSPCHAPLQAHVCPVCEVKSPSRRNHYIFLRRLRRRGNRYTEQALLLLDLQQDLSGSVRVTLCRGSWSSSSSVTPDQQVTERVLCDMWDVQSGVFPVAFCYSLCLQS